MPSPVTARTRAGLVIAALLGVGDVVSAFFPTPDGQVGPPLPVVLLGGVAWRTGGRGALRIVAGLRVLSAITALPGFFVDIPAWLKLLTAVFVVLTVVCGVLVLTPARRGAPVTD